MEPYLGRIAFNICVILVIFSLIPLPFLKSGSVEFVVDTIALIVSLTFLFFVAWDVRKQVKKESASKRKF